MTDHPLPNLTVTVYGTPAPQGSKSHKGNGRMVESSEGVRPWRLDVKDAALAATQALTGWTPLDGPLAVSMVFAVRNRPNGRPTWWPKGLRWSASYMWRPASTPDLSKLVRATEDALTNAGVWRDDARVVEYRRLAKHYAADQADDVLGIPGCVIHVWRLPLPGEAQ